VLVAAALVPPTALLVPGVAGRARVLDAERDAAIAAVASVLDADPEHVVVVPPGSARAEGRLRATFAAAGVPDVAWSGGGEGTPVDDVPAAVALWLLDRAGWSGPVRVVGSADRALAADELAAPGRVGAVLVGGGSARRGPRAPLASDPRAAAADAALQSWLATLDPAGPHGLDDALAVELAISALGPARVLASSPGPLRCTGVAASAPFDATYLVATWVAP
jgi:hypothetical protein